MIPYQILEVKRQRRNFGRGFVRLLVTILSAAVWSLIIWVSLVVANILIPD
jgi:hypothetical protein